MAGIRAQRGRMDLRSLTPSAQTTAGCEVSIPGKRSLRHVELTTINLRKKMKTTKKKTHTLCLSGLLLPIALSEEGRLAGYFTAWGARLARREGRRAPPLLKKLHWILWMTSRGREGNVGKWPHPLVRRNVGLQTTDMLKFLSFHVATAAQYLWPTPISGSQIFRY